MRTAVPVAALMLLATPIAGCLGDERDAPPADDGSTPPADDAPPDGGDIIEPNDTTELPPLTMAHYLCRQFHNFFLLPAELFREGLPEGFAPAPAPGDATGQMTTVYVHVSMCPRTTLAGVESGELQEMWASLTVTPPPELTDPNVVFHGLVLAATVSNEAMLTQYGAWGFGAISPGSVAIADLAEVPPGTLNARTTVTTAIGTYELFTHVDTAVQEGSASGAVRLFAFADGAVTGTLVYAWPGWTDVGLGYAELTFTGDFLAGAPPLSQGAAHAVLDTDQYLAGYAYGSTA